MKIRKAHAKDNAHNILELIYGTDAYIYPALMTGDIKNYEYMLLEQGMYNYKNITVATVDDVIAGIAVSFTKDAILVENYPHELQKYYKNIHSSLDNQTEYINNISVYTKFRGMGIGTKLITFIEENSIMPKIALDCLVENSKAMHLYEKMSFTVTGVYPSFCLDKSKDVKDARMEKIVCLKL